MHEHLFIARYNGEEICARYPSKEDAELYEHIANQLMHKDPAPSDPLFRHHLKNKTQNPLHVLEQLAKAYPTSFFAHHTLGNLLQDIENYDESIRAFTIAETHAQNTTLKLAAIIGTADSWKIKAEKHSEETATQAYEQASLAYKEAQEYTYAATPSLAIANTLGQALLHFAYATFTHHQPTTFPNPSTARRFLNFAHSGKLLTHQLTRYYQTPTINEALTLFENNLNTLEKQITHS